MNDTKTSVKTVAASIHKGLPVTTVEMEYPRIIHSELMTHREFSRNAASSRAIPVKAMIKNIRNNMFVPTYWGKNQSGMQAQAELTGVRRFLAKSLWIIGGHINLLGAGLLNAVGVHKQLANRNIEYISYMKTVVTSTSFDNFLALRDHEAAQPEIREVAVKLRHELATLEREELHEGEWHTPYVAHSRNEYDRLIYGDDLPVEVARAISVSCVAQTSYRKNDTSVEKALKIFGMLVNSTPIHASPLESVLTPAVEEHVKGVTGYDIQGNLLSGNSKGWIQFRHLL